MTKQLAHALVLAWLFAACKVGAPLVDRPPEKPLDRMFRLRCPTAPECDAEEPFETPLTALRDLESTTCIEPLAPHTLAQLAALSSAHCGRAIVMAGADVAAVPVPVQITGAYWSAFDLLIDSAAPVEVIVTASRLDDVRFRLHGPITLRFEAGNELTHVDISSATPEAKLVLDGVEAHRPTIGDANQRFAGVVIARHTTLYGASISAADVTLASTSIFESVIDATALTCGDGELAHVLFDLDRADISASFIDGSRVRRCGAVALFGTEVNGSYFEPCVEPLRVYDSELRNSVMDGFVIGDGSAFSTTAFGKHAPFKLQSWLSTFSAVAFCDSIDKVEMGDRGISCSTCTDAAFDSPDKLCGFADERAGTAHATDAGVATSADASMRDEHANYCEPLNAPEPCELPLPARLRPHDPMDD